MVYGNHVVYSPFIAYFQHFHDLCMVRASQAQVCKPSYRDTGKLGNRFLRVLFPGACQPYRLTLLHHRPAQDHPGGHITFSLLGLLCHVPAGGVQVELSSCLPVHSAGCSVCDEEIRLCRFLFYRIKYFEYDLA